MGRVPFHFHHGLSVELSAPLRQWDTRDTQVMFSVFSFLVDLLTGWCVLAT